MMNKTKALWAISFLLAIGCVALWAGQATSRPARRMQIVGSWIVYDTNSDARFYVSFTGNEFRGTYTDTYSDSSIGVAHGSWIRQSATTFITTGFGPIYDEDGHIVQEQKIRARLELARDPDLFVAEIFVENRLLDGTLVDSFSTTVIGRRINVDR